MLTLTIGAALGWVVTGIADYFATRRAVAAAYGKGLADGQQAALRQVSGW